MVFLLLAAAGGGYGWTLWAAREKPIEVQLAKVARRNITELVVANGRIQPVVQVKISPEVSGEIIELPFKEGQAVKKGDLLLKIKPDYYLASRRSAEASYQSSLAGQAQAAATLEKAKLEFAKNEQLFGEKLISDTAFLEFRTGRDVAEANHQASRHQVDVARAALARADEDLAKTTLYSPITGTVSKLNSRLGERVVGTAMMTGTEVMVVADLTEMEARVEVGEMDVVLMQVGLKARLEVDAFHERKFAGRITDVANSSRNSLETALGGGGASQQDATRFEVRIRIEEKERFRPGMSVTAEIETRYRTNVLAVPIQCVTTRLPPSATNSPSAGPEPSRPAVAGGAGASPVEEKRKEGTKPLEVVFAHSEGIVTAVPVKRGISDESHVEITEGLAEGREVVSGGYKAISRELKEGSRVRQAPAHPAVTEIRRDP